MYDVYIYIYIYICISTHMYCVYCVCVYIYIYIYILYVCVYTYTVHIYIYICIHTHVILYVHISTYIRGNLKRQFMLPSFRFMVKAGMERRGGKGGERKPAAPAGGLRGVVALGEEPAEASHHGRPGWWRAWASIVHRVV